MSALAALHFAALLLAAPAHAAAPTDQLVSEQLAVGVCGDGSLVTADSTLGILWDPDGPEGPAPPGEDLLLPGYPLAAWSLAYGDTVLTMGCPYTGSDLTMDWRAGGEELQWLVGTGGNEDVDVTLTLAVALRYDTLRWQAVITPHAALGDVRIAQIFDPDPDFGLTGDYATDNTLGDGVVSGQGLESGVTMALAAPGGVAYTCSFCTDIATLEAGGTQSAYEDVTLGLSVALGSVTGPTTVQFAYAFALDPEDAATLATLAAEDTDWDRDGAPTDTDCDDLDPDHQVGTPGACTDSVSDDADGDGFSPANGDCDDLNPAVYPGAAPTSGAADANCDGVADTAWSPDLPEDVPQTKETEATGGCATTPARPHGATLPLLALAMLLRRRA